VSGFGFVKVLRDHFSLLWPPAFEVINPFCNTTTFGADTGTVISGRWAMLRPTKHSHPDRTVINVSFLHRLQELGTEIRALSEERGHLRTQIEADVEKQNSDQSSLFSATESSIIWGQLRIDFPKKSGKPRCFQGIQYRANHDAALQPASNGHLQVARRVRTYL